mmetsp:Transcript_31781/g.37328  ORF Transcript_31781/g.37328 Transcript_31781/m.37328 type:complete len:104 (+) Transcript_31781:194-505(+)
MVGVVLIQDESDKKWKQYLISFLAANGFCFFFKALFLYGLATRYPRRVTEQLELLIQMTQALFNLTLFILSFVIWDNLQPYMWGADVGENFFSAVVAGTLGVI